MSERGRPSAPERADLAIVDALAPLIRSPAGKALGMIGNAGDEPPLLFFSGAVVAFGLATHNPRLARTGTAMILAHMLTVAMKEWGKDHVDRSRPKRYLEDGHYEAHAGTSKQAALRAFPSGHTAGAVAMARVWGRNYPAQAKLANAIAGTIGTTQVTRRAHWPTDVIAGALLGIVADVATHAAAAGVRRLVGKG